MPDQSLIDALETVRDTYTQRQKATNNLLNSLRSTTKTLAAAGRALNDYRAQSPGASDETLERAQAAFDPESPALRLKDEVVDPLLPELRRELKALGATVTALRDASAALRTPAVDVIKLGRAVDVLANSTPRDRQVDAAGDETLPELLPRVREVLEEAQRSLGNTFGQALRQALAELGIEIGGRPPRFEIGRFEVAADFVHRSASIDYGKIQVVRRVPLTVEAVVKAYQAQQKAIVGRNEDGNRWIEQFFHAWESAVRRREAGGRSSGGRANIVDCYYELVLLRQSRAFRSAPSKGTFAEYHRAQFAYDFFEFTNQRQLAYEGRRVQASSATKSQAESTERSIWIVEGSSPHEGRLIGDVQWTGGV